MEMPSYESIVQRMQEEFEKQAGFVPDDASDIGIRMKVLAGELFSCYTRSRVCGGRHFRRRHRETVWICVLRNAGSSVNSRFRRKVRWCFRVPPRWRTIWPSLWGRSALWRGRMVPNSSPYRKRY